MPDLPTRKKREEELAALLLLLFAGWGAEYAATGELSATAEEVGLVVAPALAGVHGEAASNLAEIQGFSLAAARVPQKSASWAGGHGKKLGPQILDTTRKGLAEGESPENLFSSERAELIATTEVTRAITTGELLILWMLWDEQKRIFEAIWYTKPERSRTGPCPVCRPLHGTTSRVWRLISPAGPPGPQPGCVCILRNEELFNA